VSSFGANNNSQVTMSDGLVRDYFIAYLNSQVTISGGRVGNIFHAGDSSHVTMTGGTLGGIIDLEYQAVLKLDGCNFAIDGIPFSSGEVTSILGGYWRNEPYRLLTGTLANGDIINNQFRIGDAAKIIIVPEPATLLLLGIGGLLFRKLPLKRL
jgi:hypothetical protein